MTCTKVTPHSRLDEYVSAGVTSHTSEASCIVDECTACKIDPPTHPPTVRRICSVRHRRRRLVHLSRERGPPDAAGKKWGRRTEIPASGPPPHSGGYIRTSVHRHLLFNSSGMGSNYKEINMIISSGGQLAPKDVEKGAADEPTFNHPYDSEEDLPLSGRKADESDSDTSSASGDIPVGQMLPQVGKAACWSH